MGPSLIFLVDVVGKPQSQEAFSTSSDVLANWLSEKKKR